MKINMGHGEAGPGGARQGGARHGGAGRGKLDKNMKKKEEKMLKNKIAQSTRYRKSLEIQLLYKRLKKMKIGDIITWSELKDVINREVRSKYPGYTSLHAARKILRREGIHFDCVSMIKDENGNIFEGGLKRLSDEEAISIVNRDINNIASRASLVKEKVINVDYDTLSDETKILHNTYLTIAEVTQRFTSPIAIDKIQSEVKYREAPIPSNDLLVLLPE